MYTDRASWWPLLSPPEDYAEAAAFYHKLFKRTGSPPMRTLLELGSGGGNNTSHLKSHFQMTLADRSPGILAVSRRLNPECEHLEGGMRTVRLGRLFDAMFVHDAICYMTSEADLKAALLTAFAHCRPGGAAFLAPDYVQDNFVSSTTHGGHDSRQRGLRYLEWSHDPDVTDTLYSVNFAYLLREQNGAVRVEHDRHPEGLFPRATWLRLLREAGFEPKAVGDLFGREVFVAVKPA
ncbi:MAG: class I SAM-dependent methyltransferase [Dehalococcoidia bacterium]|nr:class I SAM-dependent methyltransferase [Dehalococcoidia bacterium]